MNDFDVERSTNYLLQLRQLESSIEICESDNWNLSLALIRSSVRSGSESDRQLLARVQDMQGRMLGVARDIFNIVSRMSSGPSPISSIESSSALGDVDSVVAGGNSISGNISSGSSISSSPAPSAAQLQFLSLNGSPRSKLQQLKVQQQKRLQQQLKQSATVTSKSRVVHTRKTPDHRIRYYRQVSISEQDGSFTVSAKYGPVTVLHLGTVDFIDPSFHSDRYIYPIGYRIRRKFMSYLDPSNDAADYICEIQRVEGNLIQFSVELQQHLDSSSSSSSTESAQVFTGRSASGAWAQIVARAYEIRVKQPTTAICGPDLFGFTVPEIAKMVQELPNADKCTKYKWQTFVSRDSVKK